MTVVLALLFGLLQGLRHAFEPDHVIALSTMMSEERSARARLGYAAAWGLGHAAMLVLVGGLLMVLRAELPPRLAAGFELAVALMLVLLGARAVRTAVAQARRHATHDHGHAHPGPSGWRSIGPVALGVVHGLAGSGALTALVVARLPSPAFGMAFMVIFGAGAALGMAILAGVAALPLRKLLRTRWGLPALLGSTGALSLVLGLTWLWPAAIRLAS